MNFNIFKNKYSQESGSRIVPNRKPLSTAKISSNLLGAIKIEGKPKEFFI